MRDAGLNGWLPTDALTLSPGISLAVAEDAVFLHGDESVRFQRCAPWVVGCLQSLRDRASYDDLVGLGADRAGLTQLLRALGERGLVVRHQHNPWQGTRLSRHFDYLCGLGLDAVAAQEKLCAARIVVLGLGGTGSVVLQHLIAAGMRRFCLIDGDQTEASNLNRQFLYAPSDIGQAKVEVARRWVLSMEGEAEVTAHVKHVATVEDLSEVVGDNQVDLVVLAADRPVGVINRLTAQFCHDRAAAFIGGGCGLRRVDWGPLVTAEMSARYLGFLASRGEVALGYGTEPITASFGPTNTIVGAHIAHDVIHALLGLPVQSAGAVLSLDFTDLTIRRTPLPLAGEQTPAT